MVSISSKSNITKRAVSYWHKEQIWSSSDQQKSLQLIHSFLEQEYSLIPDKERVGKGSVYVAQIVAQATISFLVERYEQASLKIIQEVFSFLSPQQTNHMANYALALLGEFTAFPEAKLPDILQQIRRWANHHKWKVREMCSYPLRKAFAKHPQKVLESLQEWVLCDDENIRRVAIESLRPLRDIPWLRNPEENGGILELLAQVKADPSEYVRKSVGNNLKDLTKYMPEKILSLVADWISKASLVVTDDLASKTKTVLGAQNYYLIWTLKHALRWLQKRRPEYHPQLEVLLGKNYVLYFDEKRNKLARKK